MATQAPAPFQLTGAESAGRPVWMLQLLGRVQASDGQQIIEKFPSRAVAALWARLALAPHRAHPREELIELLWPGVAPDVGRNRLRQTLSTLKSLAESTLARGQAVIDADRMHVRVVPGAMDCDALQFERLLRTGRGAEALALYGGELLPGHYGDWIELERTRLAALHEQLQQQQDQKLLNPGPSNPPSSPAPHTRSDAALTYRLPSYLTRLFGAELAAAQLRGQVMAHRLVTLLGPGGAGKTRLAVEVATALRDHTGGEPPRDEALAARFEKVCFVALVSCSTAAQTIEALGRALRLPAADGLTALLPALSGLRVLLVLDNFEQLINTSSHLVAELLDELPQLHVLATSRHRLGLDGEVLVAAEPLPLLDEAAPMAEAVANSAVALFADRARAALSSFHLHEGNRAALIGITRLLQGLPLAIELAASRTRSFAPPELLRLLRARAGEGRLALLERQGARGARDQRHASMAAVVGWSWGLLDDESRQVLLALMDFPAPAGVPGVAAVAGLPMARVAARLDDLVAHSLARAGPGEPARFELFEPVREYAAQRGDDRTTAQVRLRHWLLAWAASLPQPLQRVDVAPELATLRTVLAHPGTPAADALQLIVSLRDFWDSENLPAPTLRMLQLAAASLPDTSALRSDAHEVLAGLLFAVGCADDARQQAGEALRTAGNEAARRARALVRQAWIEVAAGRAADREQAHHARLRSQLQQALELATVASDRDVQARALRQLGIMSAHLHASPEGADVPGAEALFAKAQTLHLALGDHRRANARLRNRAQCWVQMGRLDEAMAAYAACEEAALAEGDWLGEIDCLISRAELLARRRQWQAALDANRRCLALCWQHWHRHALAYALWNPGRLLARLHQPEAAVQLMAFASVFWTSIFGPLSAEDQRHLRRVRALSARQIGLPQTEALWQRGLQLDVASAVRLVLSAR